MNILLFGGFLGSGKTSVILQLAKYIVENKKQKVAIVENEIGEVGIDDKIIAQQGLKVTGVFAGCVCCQITGELLEAINEIKATVAPDWLIIETTGLAVPGKVVDLLNKYCHSHSSLKTIVLVDASRWPELIEVAEPLVLSQLKSADIILVNKVDLVGENTVAGLQSELQGLKGLNDGVMLVLIRANEEIPGEMLLEMTE